MERYPFFVYGTLLPGQPNHYLLADDVVAQAPAIMPEARLFDMDGFPMLLEGGYQAVNGLVIDINQAAYDGVLARLDELEGVNHSDRAASLYLRQKRQVQLLDGSLRIAWVYVGRLNFVQGRESFGGDWIAYSAEIGRDVDAWWQAYRANPTAKLFNEIPA